jgi:hypothetical protein
VSCERREYFYKLDGLVWIELTAFEYMLSARAYLPSRVTVISSSKSIKEFKNPREFVISSIKIREGLLNLRNATMRNIPDREPRVLGGIRLPGSTRGRCKWKSVITSNNCGGRGGWRLLDD